MAMMVTITLNAAEGRRVGERFAQHLALASFRSGARAPRRLRLI